METNLEVLNKISQKLGGEADATSVTESLNNIANALGDTEPDVIKSVSDSLNDILEYAGQGGGGGTDILIKSFVTTTSYGDNYRGNIGGVVIDEEGAEVFKDLPEIKLTIAEAGLTDYVLQSNGDPDEVVFGDSGFGDIDFFVAYDTDRRVLDLYSLAELDYKVVTIKK